MTAWLADLFKHLTIPTQIAWMGLALGGVFLALHGYSVGPFAKADAEIVLGFAILALVGGTVIGVKFATWLIEFGKGKVAARRSERKAIEDRTKEIAEIRTNMDTLGQLEWAQLLWILHNGNQRVDKPVVYSLISKGILKSVKPRNFHLVEVDDTVWARREELLEVFKNVRMGGPFPSGRV